MATTYTTHYNLGKQTNHADKFSMDVITDNMDIIDAELYKNSIYSVPEIATENIGSNKINLYDDGILLGYFTTDATDGALYGKGILRAYRFNPENPETMEIGQILEFPNLGKVITRYMTAGGSWSEWKEVDENHITQTSTITNSTLSSFYKGVMAGPLSTEITGGASEVYGIVRAYKLGANRYMQIAEAVDGTRKTREYDAPSWGSWV